MLNISLSITICTSVLAVVSFAVVIAQSAADDPAMAGYRTVALRLTDSALAAGRAYRMLADLTGSIGARISGSPAAERAVEWGRRAMVDAGLRNVHLQPVMVPQWVRGSVEQATLLVGKSAPRTLHISALGGSIATPEKGITAEVIEVHSLDEAEALGDRAKGKIIFFNRPMDRKLANTFNAYGGAVDQRVHGAVAAAKVGAVAVLVRSMTTAIDTFPHTGMLIYKDTVPKIPAVAVSTADANDLSRILAANNSARVHLRLDCQTLPDVQSYNVVGELTGIEYPEDVIVIGGHLDSWDIGQGAHDDGAGCVQSIEALRLISSIGLKPKRTIRAVLFMNEENGLRGGITYASMAGVHGRRHIAAIESDRGGFAPRGFAVEGGPDTVARIAAWADLFAIMGAERFEQGHGGADIGPLKEHGALNFGLLVEAHRYFDYHHSAKDTFEKVNERELELGAAAMALLAWLVSETGKI